MVSGCQLKFQPTYFPMLLLGISLILDVSANLRPHISQKSMKNPRPFASFSNAKTQSRKVYKLCVFASLH